MGNTSRGFSSTESAMANDLPSVGDESLTGPAQAIEASVSPTTSLPLAEGMSLSYWLQGVRANPLLDHRTTEDLPKEAEVVIIGSGMTGTLTAYELLKGDNPPKSVLLLEARELCSAATGRNAGHCKPDQWRGFAKYEKMFGAEQALKILANEQDTWEHLVAFIREEKIDCDLWVGKTLDVAMTEEVAALAADTFNRFKAAGGPTSHIEHITDRDEAVKRSRIKNAVSVFAWDASTLYPWKVVAHIIKLSLALGLNLQTWTPVTGVEATPSQDGKWVVKTERGDVVTPTVVHATNAYAAALLPELQNVIRPTPHMCNKTIPPRSFAGTKALQNSYGVLCPGGALFSINPRANTDGIVLFGGSNPNQHHLLKYLDENPDRRTDDSLSNFEPVTQAVIDFATEEFGWDKKTSPGQGYDYSWSGIIGRSADGVPYIGPLPGKPGQWICAGHNGHGMARIFTSAPGLVKLMKGGSWADTGLPECFQVTKERLDKLAKIDFKVPII